jgi:hypothetical protein
LPGWKRFARATEVEEKGSAELADVATARRK